MDGTTTVAELKTKLPTKKSGKIEIDDTKIYEYELCTRYEATRVKDKKTDTPLGSGWPPHFSYPNHGTAINPKTKKPENWRYIEGQSSLWVSEQPELADLDKKEINTLLGEDSNQLNFKDGRMLVRGDAAGVLRREALEISDYFEGNPNPYQKKPSIHMFRLNNPDAAVSNSILQMEKEFKTMEQAMNCSVEEMLAVSSLYNIDITDVSETGLNRIKKQFLDKAKYDPKNPKGMDFFIEAINNPETKVKYVFTQGLLKGIISVDQQPGQLTWAAPNTAIMEIGRKPVEQLTQAVMAKDKKVVEIMLEISKQLNIK